MNRTSIIALLLLISLKSTGQQITSSKIEKDLRYWLSKVVYWRHIENQNNVHWGDSLEHANQTFGKTLKTYTNNYPFTIGLPFESLKNDLGIYTTDDGLFRIYNWYTGHGGMIEDIGNLFQYKIGTTTKSVLLLGKQDEFNMINYFAVYHIDINNQPYYLAAYSYSYSHEENGHTEGIRAFTIKNGQLDQNAKIIKTATGLHNQLTYNYTPGIVTYASNDWSVTYDPTTKTITLPIVSKDGTVTQKHIYYKFTGQYFERVK